MTSEFEEHLDRVSLPFISVCVWQRSASLQPQQNPCRPTHSCPTAELPKTGGPWPSPSPSLKSRRGTKPGVSCLLPSSRGHPELLAPGPPSAAESGCRRVFSRSTIRDRVEILTRRNALHPGIQHLTHPT